jgi:hypothetical protein
VTIVRSTISGNHTPDQGGGIFSDGPLTITDSTISGNMSTADEGGGIFIENGALTIVNSTISGNAASSSGGGIFNNPPVGSANSVRILNSTITANSGSAGGGVATFDPGVIALRNTVLAGNSGQSGSPDANGTLSSEGFDLIGDTAGATIVGDTTGNITGQAPGLAPLADNGGPTETHALLAGSPALDAGDPNGCVDAAGAPLTTDQRGVPRPQGPRCDMGSFEANVPGGPTTTTTTTTLPPECMGIPRAATFASIDCRLDALVAEVNASTALGALAPKLQKQIQKARDRKEQADGFCRQPNVRRTKGALKKTIRIMVQVGKTLRSRKAQRSIPDPVRQQMLTDADAVRVDLRTLKAKLQCPAGASPM